MIIYKDRYTNPETMDPSVPNIVQRTVGNATSMSHCSFEVVWETNVNTVMRPQFNLFTIQVTLLELGPSPVSAVRVTLSVKSRLPSDCDPQFGGVQ